jgi:hypothetical protein
MKPLTPDTGAPPDWRGYAPKIPPLPQAEPRRSTMPYRLAAFGVRWICMTGTYLGIAAAVCLLATGRG